MQEQKRINEEITPLEGESDRKILSSGPGPQRKTLTLKKKKKASKQTKTASWGYRVKMTRTLQTK